MSGSSYGMRVVVDLDAYRHNLRYVRSLIPDECSIMAVVKDNAYGHGLVSVSKAALAEQVQMLGVSTVEEGAALRAAGVDAPILVMVQPPADALHEAIEHDLRVMISDVATGERLGELAHRVNKVVLVHCKVDSGMGRQGFALTAAPAELLHLTRVSHLDIEGVATHFPVADTTSDPYITNQIRAFKTLLKQLNDQGIPYEMAHAANSGAIVNYPASHFSMVRPGLMTYGIWPTDAPPAKNPLRPVMRWEAKVILVKELDAGASIGYGRTYVTSSRVRVAILPVGYGAAGYKRALSNKADVLIRGKRCPVRGTVCMDQIVVDVSHVGDVAPGDTATLLGADGNERITANELAAHAQTIPYEILTSVAPNFDRDYGDS